MNNMKVLVGLKYYGKDILPEEKKSSDSEITYDLRSWIIEIEAKTVTSVWGGNEGQEEEILVEQRC